MVPYNKWVASHKVGYILNLVNTLFTFAIDGGGGYNNIVITVIGYIILIFTVLYK